MQNKQYYISEFKSRLNPHRVRTADKSWYRQRFEWRLVFNFTYENRVWRYADCGNWTDILSLLNFNQWQYRRRIEGNGTVYTSETAFLDAVLANEKWMAALAEVEYSDDNYLNEFASNTGLDAVTDIKFVKTVPEHFYQVTLGNFHWHSDDPVKHSLNAYLVVNRNEYHFKGYEADVITRLSKIKTKKELLNSQYGNIYIGVSNGFKFYAKNTDDILMFHMIAPGKIIKIVKMMEKKIEAVIS